MDNDRQGTGIVALGMDAADRDYIALVTRSTDEILHTTMITQEQMEALQKLGSAFSNFGRVAVEALGPIMTIARLLGLVYGLPRVGDNSNPGNSRRRKRALIVTLRR